MSFAFVLVNTFFSSYTSIYMYIVINMSKTLLMVIPALLSQTFNEFRTCQQVNYDFWYLGELALFFLVFPVH